MHKPCLIQRCNLDDEGRLIYQYMGMSEFECGEQAKSLKRIFEQGITTQKCSVVVEGEAVELFLVAGKGFEFSQYETFLNILANEEWHRPEPTHLNSAIKKQLGRNDEDHYDHTNAWFDFENDVLLVLTQNECDALVLVLEEIKYKWEHPESDSPALKKFKNDLEVVKEKLKTSGKSWFSLSKIREIEGEHHVLLNPFEQRIHNFGWFTLRDLLEWVENKGPVMKRPS